MSTTEDISTEQQQTTERAAKYFDKNKLSRPAAAFDPTESNRKDDYDAPPETNIKTMPAKTAKNFR